jgi:hypothetical protein
MITQGGLTGDAPIGRAGRSTAFARGRSLTPVRPAHGRGERARAEVDSLCATAMIGGGGESRPAQAGVEMVRCRRSVGAPHRSRGTRPKSGGFASCFRKCADNLKVFTWQ